MLRGNRTVVSRGLPEAPCVSPDWPWSNAVQRLPATRPDGSSWPRISIVTPNYNYGHYLEETIRSVLMQGYPNLEYILIDGASSDNSLEIIRKYEPWLTIWESEKDSGQSHAINKGFEKATGDLIAWLNSDDVLLPGALQRIAEVHNPADEKLIFADVVNFYPDGTEETLVQSDVALENFIGIPRPEFRWHQPGMFVPRSFYCQTGGLDQSLHYIFDWDWICRLLIHRPDICYLNSPVARFRVHDASKTGAGMMECWQEAPEVVGRYKQHLSGISVRRVLAFYDMKMASLFFSEFAGCEQYWDRVRGIKKLVKAAFRDPRLLMQKGFVRLLVRALLPRCLYRSKG